MSAATRFWVRLRLVRKGSKPTGLPRGRWRLDSHGDIFVDDHEYQHHAVVLEYAPSGLFVRAITGEEAPGVGGNREDGGWGGLLGGIAFDPISGHVVVAVTRREEVAGFGRKEPVEGAVDEFEAATGKFVGQVSETSDGQHLHGAFGVAADSKGDLYVVDAGLNEASKQFETRRQRLRPRPVRRRSAPGRTDDTTQPAPP